VSQLYMLDTNTVSYIVKGMSPHARARLSGLDPGSVACISSITEGELWYGLDRIGGGSRRRNALNLFLSQMRVLPWGTEQAAEYGKFRAQQEAIGCPLGPLDTQIAAHAISVGAILVSSDLAFRRAGGLPGLENWATDIVAKGS
jgi:tRNA(fMet)-specific endonuclease VapC